LGKINQFLNKKFLKNNVTNNSNSNSNLGTGSETAWFRGSLQRGVLGGLKLSEYLILRENPVPEENIPEKYPLFRRFGDAGYNLKPGAIFSSKYSIAIELISRSSWI